MSESLLAQLRWVSYLLESRPSLAFALPASVEVDGVLREHHTLGVHHIRQFLRAPRSQEGISHLLHARRELRAASAIIGEWSAAE
jgi:hypothetical protein